MKAKEELRLVEAFSELRAGMIVVVRGCALCDCDCRGMLTEYCEPYDDDEGTVEAGWYVLPPCTDSEPDPWIGPSTVADGVVYRVVDPGLENEQARSTSKKTNQPARVR